MRDVPYLQSPHKNACALACHYMVAKSFFPETTLDGLKHLLRWKDGKVVWAFPFWLWLIEKGIAVTDYDTIPYGKWANGGFEALKGNVPDKNYEYWAQNMDAQNMYDVELNRLFARKQFRYVQRIPELEDVRKAMKSGALCEVALDGAILENLDRFDIHRVVVLDIDKTHITFHDPITPEAKPRPERRETLETFLRAWPPEVRELCVYYQVDSHVGVT